MSQNRVFPSATRAARSLTSLGRLVGCGTGTLLSDPGFGPGPCALRPATASNPRTRRHTIVIPLPRIMTPFREIDCKACKLEHVFRFGSCGHSPKRQRGDGFCRTNRLRADAWGMLLF